MLNYSLLETLKDYLPAQLADDYSYALEIGLDPMRSTEILIAAYFTNLVAANPQKRQPEEMAEIVKQMGDITFDQAMQFVNSSFKYGENFDYLRTTKNGIELTEIGNAISGRTNEEYAN